MDVALAEAMSATLLTTDARFGPNERLGVSHRSRGPNGLSSAVDQVPGTPRAHAPGRQRHPRTCRADADDATSAPPSSKDARPPTAVPRWLRSMTSRD